MEWKTDDQGDKEETFIQTRRRGRRQAAGLETITAKRLNPERWWIVEQMGQAVRQLADPVRGPTLTHR